MITQHAILKFVFEIPCMLGDKMTFEPKPVWNCAAAVISPAAIG